METIPANDPLMLCGSSFSLWKINNSDLTIKYCSQNIEGIFYFFEACKTFLDGYFAM